jgi:hypothetical protein
LPPESQFMRPSRATRNTSATARSAY